MADQPEAIRQVEADANGTWEAVVPADVTDGLHKVDAIDEQGNAVSSLLFVDRQEMEVPHPVPIAHPTIIERVLPSVPPSFAYALFFFILIVLALALNGVRLARRADRHDRHTSHRRASLGAITAAVAAVVAALAIGVALNRTVGVLDRFLPKRTVAPVTLSIAGTLVDPLGRPVSGVDLVAGDTRIRTDAGGKFAFEGIDAATGIRATHPALSRAVVYGFPDIGSGSVRIFPAELVFDPSLLNELAVIVDLEARGRVADLYARLAPDSQARIPVQTVLARMEAGPFTAEDIGMQELRVIATSTDASTRTARITLENREKTRIYTFRIKGEGWEWIE